MELIDKWSKDSLFSTGHKLSRVDIIGALVDVAMELGISAKDIHNKKELVQRILNTFKIETERRKVAKEGSKK